jgi:hypothetical protein
MAAWRPSCWEPGDPPFDYCPLDADDDPEGAKWCLEQAHCSFLSRPRKYAEHRDDQLEIDGLLDPANLATSSADR